MDPSAPTPGERRRSLDRPPGERYGPPAASAGEEPARGGTGVSPPLAAVLIAAGGAAITVLLGGVLSLSAGLLLVAGGTGWLIGRSLGGPASGAARGRGTAVAVGLAAASVVLGHIGLWLFARSEGGALGPVDYLAQTWGPLAVAQYVVAIVAAWLAAR